MDKHYEELEVGIGELEEDMIIQAYIGFDAKYCPMDDATAKWIQHNFKGSTAVVERGGDKISIPIDQVQSGDHLETITKLPPALIKIAQVNKKLVKELDFRGFLKFKVRKPAAAASPKQGELSEAIDQANTFVQKVKESIKVCENATKAVEDLMDNARHGKAETADLEQYVDNISNNESSDAISAIISLKENDQVYAHCIDVAVVFQTVYYEIVKLRGMKSIFRDDKELMLAAFLHDIGKAKVPKEILDSTKPFKRNGKEMQLIRTHPQTGAEMLTKMGMPDYFANMAHYHHVKFDPTMASSYPQGVDRKDIIFETQLLALVDAYQALTAGRSYKKSWTPPAVMRYLDATAGVEFELQLWQDFQQVMGLYPRGSFVKLSDGTQGFVMSVPQKEVLRPQVAIVINTDGEELEHHYLIDLAIEKDISISQDIDVREIFQERALEKFTNISIS